MEVPFRVIVRSESTTRSKALKGKPAASLQPELEEDVERRFTAVRKLFGYRRRDLNVAYAPGSGTLSSAQFEYRVALDVEADEIAWHREVIPAEGGWTLLAESKFQEAFGDLFEAVVCEFASPLNIPEIIDRLEDADDEGLSLDYDSRCEWLEVSPKGGSGKIRVEGNRVVLLGGAGSTPLALTRLFEQLKQFFVKALSAL